MTTAIEVPATLYGRFDDVRKATLAALRRFAEGAPWNEVLLSGPPISTAGRHGLIVLNGPAPLLADEPNFHVFLPLLLASEHLLAGDPELTARAVADSLTTAWGVLGLLAPVNQQFVYAQELHRPLLDAAIHFWRDLDAVGPLYTVGLREGARLWEVTTNIHYVLGQLGVSEEALEEALPPGGLRELLVRAAPGTAS